ncbi:MAG: pilus assembly protein TadG-related protein [Actinomycetota bacterium]
MRKTVRSERGAVLPLVSVMLIGLLALTALVVDGGVLFASRRDLQGLADSAARAGAMALDQNALRSRDVVALDPSQAKQAAMDYLRTAGFGGSVTVRADTLAVTVDLAQDRPTVMMSLLGIRNMKTEAHAVARPRAGIEQPEG